MKLHWLRNRKFWLKFWLFLLCGILITVLAKQLPLEDSLTSFKDGIRTLGLLSSPVFILLYLMATIIGLPNILLILAAGSLFGLGHGIVLVSIADTLGAIACFLIGRTVARDRIKRWLSQHPNLSQLDQAVGSKGWKILLLTRLSPLVPSNLLNYGFSCTKVNFWQYCFFSWLGMLPVITLYVYVGAFGMRLLIHDGWTPGNIALQLVGIALAIGAAVYATRLTRQALAPTCNSQSDNPTDA